MCLRSPWGNVPLYTCSDVKEMYEKSALHVQSCCFGPFLFSFFCKLRLRYRRLIAVPDEFLTGGKIWAATSLTQNCSIFCSVHTDLEQLRVYKFLRLRWFRVGTEHLNAQIFSRSKTRPVPCERSPNNFACWIFFRIINATGQLYSGQNYST